MIALDTNILVRYLTQDDPVQSRRATQVIESAMSKGESLFITNIAMCELVWVLEGAYQHAHTDIAETLELVLRVAQFAFEDKSSLWHALDDYQRGKGEFSDHLLGRIATIAGCDHTLTFDRALKNNRQFRLL